MQIIIDIELCLLIYIQHAFLIKIGLEEPLKKDKDAYQ